MKRLVLLGGGHAHVHVLRALAQQRLSVAEVLLLTPSATQVYSGMVPGLVAGHYTAAQCGIALAPLAAAAGVLLVEGQAVGLDTAARKVHLADGRSAEYDVLSIDTGAVQRRDALPGAREHGLFVRPMEHFMRLQAALPDLAAQRPLDVVVLGGGAAGFELALALQYRLNDGAHRSAEERVRVALVTGGAEPLAGYPAKVLKAAARVLAARRITVFREAAAAIEAGTVVLASGARLACDVPVIATGAEAPPWLAGSGLGRLVAEAGIEPMLRSWIYLDNHDTPRLATAVPDEAARRMLQVLQFTLPGSPNLYYGSEVDMTGGDDPEMRAPMRWDLVAADVPALRWMRQLLALRRSQRALRVGNYREVSTGRLYAFERHTNRAAETVIVVVNPGPTPVRDTLMVANSKLMDGSVMIDLLGTHTGEPLRMWSALLDVTVPPCGVLVLQPDTAPRGGYTNYKRVQ